METQMRGAPDDKRLFESAPDIIHRVENVTDFVLLKEQGFEQVNLTDELRERAVQMEADLYSRSREVAETSLKLKQAFTGFPLSLKHLHRLNCESDLWE